ncbi:uncharacterized protein B0I36DRAFT_315872 [Microdochium trichocladiopsis]|uniref:Secreted protein n=1 Tax=Microdochium trichocladiopsis TaxID=1682393 RepID=A0A9P9BYP6_9PEZI|nr:uncharacterized protein B0I36DRAFT_315872 [Microdochium trichocladiopsis]KAH7038248.1 hypothetical protein B0I36DRAFT_315872 [Microdochium trichocladiopsis]
MLCISNFFMCLFAELALLIMPAAPESAPHRRNIGGAASMWRKLCPIPLSCWSKWLAEECVVISIGASGNLDDTPEVSYSLSRAMVPGAASCQYHECCPAIQASSAGRITRARAEQAFAASK